jgi:hypothetical protein
MKIALATEGEELERGYGLLGRHHVIARDLEMRRLPARQGMN